MIQFFLRKIWRQLTNIYCLPSPEFVFSLSITDMQKLTDSPSLPTHKHSFLAAECDRTIESRFRNADHELKSCTILLYTLNIRN